MRSVKTSRVEQNQAMCLTRKVITGINSWIYIAFDPWLGIQLFRWKTKRKNMYNYVKQELFFVSRILRTWGLNQSIDSFKRVFLEIYFVIPEMQSSRITLIDYIFQSINESRSLVFLERFICRLRFYF